MKHFALLFLCITLSSTVLARGWSDYSVVSKLKVYDGTISFILASNDNDVLESSTCDSNRQLFVVDSNAAEKEFILSALLASQSTGSEIRVLPSSPDSCAGGGARIGSFEFK